MVAGNAHMIHVVHVITRTNIGGPSVMLVDLINEGDHERFRHTVIRGATANNEGDYLVDHPISGDVITLPSLKRSLGVFNELRSLFQVVRFLRLIRPDIVHTHMAKAGVVGRCAGLIARVPVRIHTFHGHLLHGYFSPFLGRVVAFAERACQRFTTFSLVVGDATRRDLLAANIVNDSTSAVVLPAAKRLDRGDPMVARKEHGVPIDRIVVGFVGRLTDIKRPDRFLNLARELPDAHFVIFGNGPRNDSVRDEASRMDNVTVVDFSTDLASVFGSIDLMVLTSENEGVPLSLIEAASAGIPVVSFDVGGVSEIVEDGVTGLLVRDEASFHAAVSRLVQDSVLRRTFGTKARHDIHARFSLQNYLAIHEGLYTRLVTRYRR